MQSRDYLALEVSWAVLVWSFAIVPGATFQGRPDHKNALDLPGMPVHHLDQVLGCSCLVRGSIFVPNEDIAILTPELSLNDSGSESDQDDQGISDHNSAEDEHYTSIFQIRGLTYGEQYQQNLKEVQGALRQCISVPVRLLLEEDNPKDKNAICVNVTVNSKDLKLGYFGVKKNTKGNKDFDISRNSDDIYKVSHIVVRQKPPLKKTERISCHLQEREMA